YPRPTIDTGIDRPEHPRATSLRRKSTTAAYRYTPPSRRSAHRNACIAASTANAGSPDPPDRTAPAATSPVQEPRPGWKARIRLSHSRGETLLGSFAGAGQGLSQDLLRGGAQLRTLTLGLHVPDRRDAQPGVRGELVDAHPQPYLTQHTRVPTGPPRDRDHHQPPAPLGVYSSFPNRPQGSRPPSIAHAHRQVAARHPDKVSSSRQRRAEPTRPARPSWSATLNRPRAPEPRRASLRLQQEPLHHRLPSHRNRHDRAEGSRAMILSAMRP